MINIPSPGGSHEDGPGTDRPKAPRGRIPVPHPAVPAATRAQMLAGAVLLRGGTLSGLAVTAVVLSAAFLLPLGLWQPIVVLPVTAVGFAVAWRLSALPGHGPVPVRPAVLSCALAAGYTLWAALTHAEHIVLRRDPGSYALYAQWIATRHHLPVSSHLESFGGSAALDVPGFSLASPAYYQVTHGGAVDIVPQFLPGNPALLSLGWWVGHWEGLLVVPAITGGLSVLAAAGLGARLFGPRWAPFVAAGFVSCFPVLHAVRTTFSEGPALVMTITAVTLCVEAVRRQDRTLALLAGALLGLTGLIRVDALTAVAMLLPACTVLALRRDRVAAPLAAGALGGIGLSAAVAVHLSWPYLDSIRGSLMPLLAGTGVLSTLCFVVVGVDQVRTRRADRAAAEAPGRQPGEVSADDIDVPADTAEVGSQQSEEAEATPCAQPGRWARALAEAPTAAFALVWVIGAVLLSRPLWQKVHQAPDDPAVRYVAGLQRAYGLEVDGSRTYAEHSLYWLGWWIGPVALIAAWAVIAVLVRKTVAWGISRPVGPQNGSRTPDWFVPAFVGFAVTLLTLYRPGITPDHPWADRRIVVVTVPMMLFAATAAAAHLRATRPGRWTVALLVAMIAAPLGASAPFVLQRTEVGQPEAVAKVCDALKPGDVVLAVDARAEGGTWRAANEWPQVIRGVCDRPAASLTSAAADLPYTAARMARLIRESGGRPVLLSATPGHKGAESLKALGLDPLRAVSLVTTQDQRSLVTPPVHGSSLTVEVWLAPWDEARDLAASDTVEARG